VIVRSLISYLVMLLLFGCAGIKKMPEPIVASIAGASEVFHRNQILDLASGKALSFSELMDCLSPVDVVFVGETHHNPEHHLIQVQILQALSSRVQTLTVGMEFFQQHHQAALDRYLKEDMTEEDFLTEVDWKRTWGYPYHFYRPLLLGARAHGLHVLALNAPRNIVRTVARKGLAGLEEEERALIPQELDLSNDAHRAYIRETYERHDHEKLQSFEFFYEAQCVWDETMARNIADFMSDHGGSMVVFSGNGHIIHRFGVPDRTQRRVSVSVATLMPYTLHHTMTLEKGIADYVWLTAP
jgi:uncharacterized iron-regulated protein